MTTTVKTQRSLKLLQEEVAAATCRLYSVEGAQLGKRARAERQLRRAQEVLAACEQNVAPALENLRALENELHARRNRTLGAWKTDDQGRPWPSCNRYLFNREEEWYTRAAWLRVGLWLPQPRWFLDVHNFRALPDVRGGQVDLGAPNDCDPDDVAKVRARADQALLDAGYLLIEIEDG